MPGSEFFAAEKEGSGTALKTRMGSKAVSGSFPGQSVSNIVLITPLDEVSPPRITP
jgi:hypothetical protein